MRPRTRHQRVPHQEESHGDRARRRRPRTFSGGFETFDHHCSGYHRDSAARECSGTAQSGRDQHAPASSGARSYQARSTGSQAHD